MASEEPVTRPQSVPRAIVVDDRPNFRLLLRRLVEATSFEFAAEADSGERAVAVARVLRPDLVLMDVEMPGLGGIEAARLIKRERPATVVVLVSADHPDDLPPGAASCLADEIVWKSKLRPALLEEIWRRRREAVAAT